MANFKTEMKGWIKALLIVAGIGGMLYAGSAMAVTANTVSGIYTNLKTNVSYISKILVMIAVVAGMGFVMASFFKFHQHKLNPTQVPLSQGITLVIIGAAMIVFPYLLNPVTKAVFGNSAAKISGGAITKIIGS